MENAKSTRRQGPKGLSLRMPSRLVVDLIRLAELMGTPFQVELAVNLATALERHAVNGDPAAGKAIAKRLPTEPEAWETVRLWLPTRQTETLRELAAGMRLPMGKTLAVLLAPVVDEHLQVATYALEHGVSFLKARRAVTGQPAELLTAAPVTAKAAKRRATRKRSA